LAFFAYIWRDTVFLKARLKAEGGRRKEDGDRRKVGLVIRTWNVAGREENVKT
jgi:hypothetical protein